MSSLTLIIGNKNYSSWSLRPWYLLKQFDVAFNEIRVPLFTEQTPAQLSPYFSNNKVPVLKDGELLVWDTLAIMEYVNERYLDGKAWPDDAAARAWARSYSAEMHASFAALRNALPMNCRKHFPQYPLTKDVQKDVVRISALWAASRERYGDSGPWLFGSYSIADAMFAPVVLRFSGYDVALDEMAQAYVKHVLKQPAIIEWVEAGKQETEIIEEDEV